MLKNWFYFCIMFKRGIKDREMVIQNYQQLVEKIAKSSGLSVEEVDRKVEAKCAKLSGLISKEGSAQIVASELGISFDKERLKVSEIATGMRRINIIGKIIKLNPIREFKTKNNIPGKVLSMNVADDSGNIRVVLWDTNHIALFESEKIREGDVVDISNATIRNDELHLSGFSDIKLSSEIIDNVNTQKRVIEKKINELKSGDSVMLRAVVVQMFEPKFFEVCPECGKKVNDGECAVHGKVIPVKRHLLSVVLDDGSGNMRAVLFSEQIMGLGINEDDLTSEELFTKKKESILGEEAFFVCNVRNNNLFNTTELIINEINQIDIDSLISSLKS